MQPLPERPLVSVLIPNYNYERFISAALDSLLAQTYHNFEAIVCDDGSDDGSPEIVKAIAVRDDRIRLIQKANGGVASALNRAYHEAHGQVICLLDADDTFHPERLQRVVAALQAKLDWGLIVNALMLVDESGTPIQRKPSFGYFEEGWIRDRVISRGGQWGYVEASGVSLRSDVAQWVFPIPEQRMKTWADAFICVAGALVAPVGYIDEVLADYRIHGSNVSGSNTLSLERSRGALDGYRRLVGAVNDWSQAVDASAPELDVACNLGYVESLLMSHALDPEVPWGQGARTFLHYARLVVSDDVYSVQRKILSVLFTATALLMPTRFRARWLTAGLTHSALKEKLRRWGSIIGHVVRTNSDRTHD